MRIAFLGLGQMGRRMVPHLIGAGHDVSVWNRSPEATAAFAGRARISNTPGQAADGAEAVLSMLTDDAASRAVWQEVLQTTPKGALAVEMSTVSPTRIAELAEETRASGQVLVDAPVAGTLPQADAGQLIFLAGGENAAVARFAPLVEAMGSLMVHAGQAGSGAILKLMVNTMLAVQTVTAAELIRFGIAGGFSPEHTAGLLSDLPVTSPAAAIALKQIAAGQHDPLFPIDLMVKDLGYYLNGHPAPVAEAAHAAFERAQDAGFGDKHISAVTLVDGSDSGLPHPEHSRDGKQSTILA